MPLRAFGEGALFGEASGTGPPQVLALHGWARRGADFRPALEGFSFVAVDLPGFGATPPPVEVIGGAGYARAIEPVLAEFPDQLVLVGHSFGGRVAVHLAAARPERFKGMILTGVPLLRRDATADSPIFFRVARWAARRGLVPQATMERLRRRYGSADYRAAAGVMRGVLVKAVNESYEDQLASITIPVVLLWGAEDTEVPVAVAEGAAAILRAAGATVKLVVEPAVGHLLPVVSPESLHRAVDEMIHR
jgi:pimeloyl-ACP methyl ester carboxylesterase